MSLAGNLAKSTSIQDDVLLELKNVKKYFPVTSGFIRRQTGSVKAVDDISVTLKRGETLGLVGESGCGKSTLGRVVMRLLDPTDGQVLFERQDITNVRGEQLRTLRRNFQMVFQDPYSSLNPRMNVGRLIAEPMLVNKTGSHAEIGDRVVELLKTVGLNPDQRIRYPHEFSGGQRQRIAIARALALRPKLIVADEAVSALDVSIQAQILNLLMDLRDEFGFSYLFISHNLSVVKHVSDRVGVMYLGRIVELATKHELYANPMHPYTQALMQAAPAPKRQIQSERIILSGDVPNPASPPAGCAFHTRCPKVMKVCREQRPLLQDDGTGHLVACHLFS